MSVSRVQKLLFSEYCDFEDMVLVESPFAQTTREGLGIRQVYLGLTPTKLVLATDVIPPVDQSCFFYTPGLDPDIETFELVAIYPVESVNLSIFSRRKRQTLKAHFCNNSVFYFELGGLEKRNMFWNLWCERIKFLCPGDNNSNSETSASYNSSTSTLYLVDSKKILNTNGLKQIWCKFGTGKSPPRLLQKWTDRYLYMGKNFEEVATNYLPIMHHPIIHDFVKNKLPSRSLILSKTSVAKELCAGDSVHINRFGSGVSENCTTGLFLPCTESTESEHFLDSSRTTYFPPPSSLEIFCDLAETAVCFWEQNRHLHQKSPKRRFGYSPNPLFLSGLGPWNISKGDRFSVQIKRAVSCVYVKRPTVNSDLRLPVSKRQLITTISCDALQSTRILERTNLQKLPTVIFWTPCYWYRPRTARAAYKELRSHLKCIREWREHKDLKRRKFRKTNSKNLKESDSDSDSELFYSKRTRKPKKRNSNSLFNIFSKNNLGNKNSPEETHLEKLKNYLRPTLALTAWDFDSSTLAEQLTLIDKDLFSKITVYEIGLILCQQSSKNAPNISAFVAFSHRISCLICSEILSEATEKIRARLISRFINVADKCHKISNFHTCKSVLNGLQSPSIFRLKKTWAYVRKKHATTYQVFEFLCKLFRDVRLPGYQKSFFVAVQDPPYLPYIGDIFCKLFDRIPEYRIQAFKNSDSKSTIKTEESKSSSRKNPFSKIIMSIKDMVAPSSSNSSERLKKSSASSRKSKFKSLHDYFKPMDIFENNRKKNLEEANNFLQKCQLACVHYNFTKNDLACEYLLKARYKEERDNYINSLNVESQNENNKNIKNG